MRPALAILFFIAGTLLMMFLYREELLLLILMAGSSMACLAVDGWKNTKKLLAAMLVGGACENVAVMLGAWSYSNAGYLYAPLWLPVGWGMAVVLLEEAFSKNAHAPEFSKKSLAMAFGGTIITGVSSSNEMGVLFGFAIVTIALFLAGFYHRSEIRMGIFAAIFGTIMESACIITGNWQYTAAALSVFGLAAPLWLPLCWFNAFLIMRRIIRV
jgi:uncharacterized membrane protein YoaT (DUF817 family)